MVRGSVRIDEVQALLGPQSVFGEIAMFSTARRRTQSATAAEATELLWVGDEDLALICHQHPALTLHLIRLVTNRLVANSERYGAVPTAGRPSPPVAAEGRLGD